MIPPYLQAWPRFYAASNLRLFLSRPFSAAESRAPVV